MAPARLNEKALAEIIYTYKSASLKLESSKRDFEMDGGDLHNWRANTGENLAIFRRLKREEDQIRQEEIEIEYQQTLSKLATEEDRGKEEVKRDSVVVKDELSAENSSAGYGKSKSYNDVAEAPVVVKDGYAYIMKPEGSLTGKACPCCLGVSKHRGFCDKQRPLRQETRKNDKDSEDDSTSDDSSSETSMDSEEDAEQIRKLKRDLKRKRSKSKKENKQKAKKAKKAKKARTTR